MTDNHEAFRRPEVHIVASVPEHVAMLKNNLREEDRQEILRFGITIERAVWRSYRRSYQARTAFVDGEIAAMWGCNGNFLGTGRPWLLTTAAVKNISPLTFIRIYQQEVEDMLGVFPVLANYVDASYNSAIRALEIIGFDIGEPEPIGFKNELYRKFEMRA